MSDIVERLRQDAEAGLNGMGFDALSDLEREAAAEIERLRSLLREWLDGTALLTLTGSREFAARVREALGDVPDAD